MWLSSPSIGVIVCLLSPPVHFLVQKDEMAVVDITFPIILPSRPELATDCSFFQCHEMSLRLNGQLFHLKRPSAAVKARIRI